jgi:hypothetical protein
MQKQDWVERVKEMIAAKAGILTKETQTIEAVARCASKKLKLPRLVRGEKEDAISYTGRLIKHFDLGREFDAKVPDANARSRRRAAWERYQNGRMGLR